MAVSVYVCALVVYIEGNAVFLEAVCERATCRSLGVSAEMRYYHYHGGPLPAPMMMTFIVRSMLPMAGDVDQCTICYRLGYAQ